MNYIFLIHIFILILFIYLYENSHPQVMVDELAEVLNSQGLSVAADAPRRFIGRTRLVNRVDEYGWLTHGLLRFDVYIYMV